MFLRIKEAFPLNDVVALYGGNTKEKEGDIVILTMHQIYRYENYFDFQLHFKNSKSIEVSKQITPLECFLTYKGEIERITPVSLSNKEFEEFKDRY